MNALVMDPAMILAAAAELRMDAIHKGIYRKTPIGKHVGRYLDDLQFNNYLPNTVTNREATLGELALDYAHLEIAEVTTDHLRDFLATHWKDAKVNTRAMHVSGVRTFFAWAHDHDLITVDPARKIKSPRAANTERRAHSRDTIKKLVLAQDSRRDRVAILMLYWCALRRSELRLVQFRHIDLARRVLIVFGKGGTVLEQNIPEQLALELERHIQDRQAEPEEYLLYPYKVGRHGAWPSYDREVTWENRRAPLSRSGIDHWWQRCRKNADLDDPEVRVLMHELRHSAGTHIHETGGDLVATQHFLRHRSAATTERTYIHLDRVKHVAKVQRLMIDPMAEE